MMWSLVKSFKMLIKLLVNILFSRVMSYKYPNFKCYFLYIAATIALDTLNFCI